MYEQWPKSSECTKSSSHVKISAKHIWSECLELVEDYRHTSKNKELYEQRKQMKERVFAKAKEKYAMEYIFIKNFSAV
ncbi:transposase [Ructibacterium gallinarum]|uniref:transposase n=1 Tax=Ructibacterium gallinarum TaxID=2779355 RepID=UPI001CF919FC|nr:transposase [Ructibacterium gallinarum]